MTAHDDQLAKDLDRLDREDAAYDAVENDSAAMEKIFYLIGARFTLFQPKDWIAAIYRGDFAGLDAVVRAAIQAEADRQQFEKLNHYQG